MTIKHAIPKIVWAIELLYNSVMTGVSWGSDKLETRCGRESHHPAEGALGTLDGVWRPDRLVIRCNRESWQSGPPGLQLSIRRTRKTQTLMAIRVGVNILQFCSVSNSLSHTQHFQIKWEVYFFKEVFARLYYCVNMYSACICVCIMCVYYVLLML